MPQVASNPNIHTFSHTLARPTRPTQQPDSAPSPFESLLDDGTQPTDQPAPPTPPESKAAPADNSQPSVKTKDSKPTVTNDNTVIKQPDEVDPLEKPDGDGKTAADSKTAGEIKLVEADHPGGDAKSSDGGKSTDGQKPDNTTATMPNTTTIVTTDNIAAVALPAASTDQSNQSKQSPQQQTLPTDPVLPLIPNDIAPPKVAAAKQTNSGKPAANVEKQVDDAQSGDEMADETQLSAKVAAPEPHDVKPQVASNDSDKQHVAEARGDAAPKSDLVSLDASSVSANTDSGAPNVTDNAVQPTIPAATGHTAPTAPATTALVSPPGPQVAAIPLSGVPLEIAGKALAGKNRFEIRLDPPELGRIQVRLDVDRDGNVTSRLTVDRAETLDLLRRDASGLERALQDAGLKTSDNGLQFALRDQSMSQQQTSSGPETTQLVVNDETLPSIDASLQNYNRLAGPGGGLDIRV